MDHFKTARPRAGEVVGIGSHEDRLAGLVVGGDDEAAGDARRGKARIVADNLRVGAGDSGEFQHARRAFVGGTGAMAFLLAAEVIASTAVVSEAALIYVAPKRNLLISLAMIAVQAALELLRPGGLLTIAVYPGHEGGAEEGRSIAVWAAALESRRYEVQHLRPINRAASPPELWVVWKRG